MSNDTTTNPSAISSSSGRSWLNKQTSASSPETLERPSIQVVTIPNMNRMALPQTAISSNTTQVNSLSGAKSESASAGSATADRPEGKIRSGLESVKAAMVSSLSDNERTDEVLVASLVDRNSTSLPPKRQNPSNDDGGRAGKRGFLGTLKKHQPEIEPLVEQILERFPGDSPCVLLFAGSEENPHVEYTAAHTAMLLADRVDGNTLLVDSDFEGRNLSTWQGAEESNGVCDFLTRNCSWRETLCDTGDEKLDFVPVGKVIGLNLETAAARLSKTVADMKSDYRVICVIVGDAHSKASGIWSSHASGTYLVVSMTGSSQTVAKSAVSQLQMYGARLLGCVVSDTVSLRVDD